MTIQGIQRGMKYQGTVSVPLYEVPYDPVPFGIAGHFDSLGRYPFLNGQYFYSNLDGTVRDLQNYLAGIGGITEINYSHPVGGSAGASATYTGEYFVGQAPPATSNHLAVNYARVPQLPYGTVSLFPHYSESPTAFSFGTGIGTPNFIQSYDVGNLVNPSFNVCIGTSSIATPWSVSGVHFEPSTVTWSRSNMFAMNYVGSYVIGGGGQLYCCPFSGVNYGLWDSATDGSVTINRVCFQWTEQIFGGPDFFPILFNPVFDNPTLESFWTGAGAAYVFQGQFQGGFILTLNTNGAGPTGQRNEVVIIDPSFQKYWLLRFIAQSPSAVTALARATGAWPTKISPDGILYWNSGNGADAGSLWYTYSPIPWGFPQFSYSPGTYRLPCYTTCYPYAP